MERMRPVKLVTLAYGDWTNRYELWNRIRAMVCLASLEAGCSSTGCTRAKRSTQKNSTLTHHITAAAWRRFEQSHASCLYLRAKIHAGTDNEVCPLKLSCGLVSNVMLQLYRTPWGHVANTRYRWSLTALYLSGETISQRLAHQTTVRPPANASMAEIGNGRLGLTCIGVWRSHSILSSARHSRAIGTIQTTLEGTTFQNKHRIIHQNQATSSWLRNTISG